MARAVEDSVRDASVQVDVKRVTELVSDQVANPE
jgi:hypothetical protein